MPEDKWSCCTFGECRTGIGQLVQFECRPGEEKEVKEFFNCHIRKINIPNTKNIGNTQHGSCGRFSRFNIVQHKYAGGGYPGCGGYIEVLEIKNPPDHRCNFVVCKVHQSSYENRSFFTEWKTLAEAINAFEEYWRNSKLEEDPGKLPGFIRLVNCGALTPWFYAMGDEELIDDYAFPEGLQNDPVFRFGTKCLVYEYADYRDKDFPTIKTCMGTRFVEKVDSDYWSWSGKKTKRTYRIIYWSDGTYWDENKGGSRRPPHPLRENEIWVIEAIQLFNDLLAGKRRDFEIEFIDGTKFVGKIVPDNSRAHCVEGSYHAKVTFTDGGKKEGSVDFTPTPKEPTVLERIKQGLAKAGKQIERIEILNRKTAKKGKKWAGVFYAPPKN